MKKEAILMVVVVLVVGATLSEGAYMQGPKGVLMGLLVEPPDSGGGVVARCDDSQMQSLNAEISAWTASIGKIRNEERKVGDAVANVAGLYKHCSPQARYFNELASAINGQDGLTSYLDGIYNDLNKAKQCIWDDQYVQGGCRDIPPSCFDEGQMSTRITQSLRGIQSLNDNLNQRASALERGLPSRVMYFVGGDLYPNPPKGCYQDSKGWHGCSPGNCNAQQAPCQQNMTNAINSIVNAQSVIEKHYSNQPLPQ
jgi:hypothetical protein